MRRLRITKTRRRVTRPTTVRLPPGTACFDVTAHPVGDCPKRVAKAGLELFDVDKLHCRHSKATHVGHTNKGRWVAFDMKGIQ